MRPGLWTSIILWIPGVRDAFETAERERLRAATLQGENIALRHEIESVRTQVAEAVNNERIAYQTQINIGYQQRYGIKPFPESPALPDSFNPTGAPSMPQFVSGHELAKRRTQEKLAEFYRANGAGRPAAVPAEEDGED